MKRRRTILLSLLLSLPVWLFVAHHYFVHSPELQPTGFTNEENVLYMSYAHQYADQHPFSLTYSNPFDGNPASPRIYFQPATLIFGGLIKMGMDPGLCFSLFGMLMTTLCIFMGIKILRHLLPDPKQLSLTATLFTWGGGLTALAGLVLSSFSAAHHMNPWIDGIYIADPGRGWWALNWGRNLFIPLEAYYHFLFLLNIYLILTQRWIAAVFGAVFLSVSHPFTGIEYLLIILGWILAEKVVYKNKSIPWWFFAAMIAATGIHMAYYLFYLNSFVEHNTLFSQYIIGWTYSLPIAAAAYCLVTGLGLLHVFRNKAAHIFLGLPQQRLFLLWAVIAFLLSKHEWFIRPVQPIHFTRGYIWSGMFLFGLPGLLWLISYLKKWRILLYGFILVFLSDNILWTANLLKDQNKVEWEGHISKETREVLDYLHEHTTTNDLLIGNATLVNYLANVYSPANAWISHYYNTPRRGLRMEIENYFLQTGKKPGEWSGRRIVLIIDKRKENPATFTAFAGQKIFENDDYDIFIP